MSGYTVDPRIRWTEWLPWLAAIAFFFLMPGYLSLGARILRRHAELVGLRSDFTILDVDDQPAVAPVAASPVGDHVRRAVAAADEDGGSQPHQDDSQHPAEHHDPQLGVG